ncbi:AaceriAER001Cp [[Ashbya] aceris (nom. inval.)]|nr:AaceriAER001Cp [[Ashbya] aceris (nom. inval.)]
MLQGMPKRSGSISELHDPFSSPDVYYGPATDPRRQKQPNKYSRTRTMSIIENVSNFKSMGKKYNIRRRGSEDDSMLASSGHRKFYINDVDKTLEELLESEDTDGNYQITIEDRGPKALRVGTANSNGFRHVQIRGTYMLSNLLQELTIAKNFGRKQVILDEARLNEDPVNRLTRLITHQFWDSLTRRIDYNSIATIAADTKVDTPGAKVPRIYVPHGCPEQYEYFIECSHLNPSLNLEVKYLPDVITPEHVQSLNESPGLLALAMERHMDPITGESTLVGFPYVVPGGRFNELYGWDSYLMALGLLECNKVDIARGMVEHFIFEIDHYGKILNANRSYYLCRSQPPFLTDMALKVFEKFGGDQNPTAVDFLKRAFMAAIKEYKSVWMAEPRYDRATGLSCYHPDGIGFPPETEPDHFDAICRKFAEKHNVTIPEFRRMYDAGEVHEPELDEFFLHDRAVRESGHDTSYRLENVCAYLATIDLNSLLYKYEKDIAYVVSKYFDDEVTDYAGETTTSSHWEALAEIRKQRITKYLWDEETGFFYDYNVHTEKRTSYDSATTFWSMWAGLATQEQANAMVEKALPRLEMLGGLVACTEESRGEITINRPSRQWDYPYGWAPHQMLAWTGLDNYGFTGVARRLAYRWLFLMTKAFVDYNGIVVEKYDVTRGTDPHRVDAEYGNQGADFKGVATEGFGWVNSSYILGLKFMNTYAKRALANCTVPDIFFKHMKQEEKARYALT